MFNACPWERQWEAWRENNEDYDDRHDSHLIWMLIFIYLKCILGDCVCGERRDFQLNLLSESDNEIIGQSSICLTLPHSLQSPLSLADCSISPPLACAT